MLQNWIVVPVLFAYIGLLFAVASFGDRLSEQARTRISPVVFPLSLTIYFTAWTFFGTVGLASRSGIQSLSFFFGATLMVSVFTPFIHRVVRLAKAHNITSIADFIAARYGKSQAVATTVALIALIGSLPYIALQLKAMTLALDLVLSSKEFKDTQPMVGDISLIVTLAMAIFAILFGTRHADATEHQTGLMLAIAVESIVKLLAFVVMGCAVAFYMFTPTELLQKSLQNPDAQRVLLQETDWTTFTLMATLSFFAILLLPRQFHVTVVENTSARELQINRWFFPLYFIAINIFLIPIGMAGLILLPPGSAHPDMIILALPLAWQSEILTTIVFIGGLSAGTSMVIVECIALGIMISNHIAMPLLLQHYRGAAEPHSYGGLLLKVRRVAICGILILVYFYDRHSGKPLLASVGLLSFAAIAQIAPAFFGGLFWRRGTASGAIGGMTIGFAVWFYTLFLPSFAEAGVFSAQLLQEGPFGISLLRPQALFGTTMAPLLHGVLWSLALNVTVYVVCSLASKPSSIEKLQAELFLPAPAPHISPNFRRWRTMVTVGDVLGMVGQYVGHERARRSFETLALAQRINLDRLAPADFQLMLHAEHLIASVIGVSSARLVVSMLLRRRSVSGRTALKLFDNAHAALHYNQGILQTALNHVRHGIAVFNDERRLICFNRQFGEILDLSPQMMQIGITLDEILIDMKPKVAHVFDANESFVAQRLHIYTTEGAPHQERFPDRNLVVEIRVSRMPEGVVVTFSDITQSVEIADALELANATLENRVRERTEELTRLNVELERAKGIAERANQSKTSFLAAASHDLLQPLNAARLYVTSLVERQIGGEDARLVANIDSSLVHIEELLGALLDISRLDAGALKASVACFSTADILRSLELEFKPIARAKGLDLTFVLCSLPIRTDRTLILRLLQNLISNAIKYTPNGRVLVGCRRRGAMLELCVIDNGIGIPDSQRAQIFQEFYRLDEGAQVARGLGLGLSIVERIARVLGHELFVAANPSGGSRFSVTVPIADKVTYAGTIANVMSSSRTSMKDALIVVVENEPAILDGMRTLIQGWGAQVITEPDSARAMARIEELGRTPTGLVVDYHLDDGDGLTAVDNIRRRFGESIPAVLLTADRTPKVRETARAASITMFNKPLKPASLRAILGQWSRMQASSGG